MSYEKDWREYTDFHVVITNSKRQVKENSGHVAKNSGGKHCKSTYFYINLTFRMLTKLDVSYATQNTFLTVTDQISATVKM